MRVELPAERIETEVETRLQKVGRTAKIKGFRPGKIPPKVIRQHYGVQVRQEVLSELMRNSYQDAIAQENLSPVAGPKIEPDNSGADDGFAFFATFDVLPDIELKDLDKIEITRPEVGITGADLDDMILNLRKQKATWSEVERASAEGDRVVVDFEGQLKGETIEGGTGEQVPIVLGEGQMLPDFEKALFGTKAGEETSFKVKFPKDYHAEDLRNKKVDFSVSVHRVEEEELPSLDDTLADTYGVEKGGLDQLKVDVKENMQREARQKVAANVKDQVLQSLLTLNPLEIPNSLKHQEMHSMQHEAMRQMGIDDHDKAPPIDNFAEGAERRVRLGLLVRQIIDDNNLVTDADKLRERVEEICSNYQNADEMVATYMANPQVIAQIEPMVLEEQAVDWLTEQGVVKTEKVGFKEFMKP